VEKKRKKARLEARALKPELFFPCPPVLAFIEPDGAGKACQRGRGDNKE
jgi:hypothetical protein